MLAVVDRLTAIAADVRADARVADADGDRERREYLMGEHRGLMEAAEVLLTFDWTAAWREACTIRTVEQLAAVPFLGVVREVFRASPVGGVDYGGVWERRSSGWEALSGSVMPPGYGSPHLPALLVWHPDWEAS